MLGGMKWGAKLDQWNDGLAVCFFVGLALAGAAFPGAVVGAIYQEYQELDRLPLWMPVITTLALGPYYVSWAVREWLRVRGRAGTEPK